MNDPFFEVLDLPDGRAIITFENLEVYREEGNQTPASVNDSLKYIPWGDGNQLPYNILRIFEQDETLSACQMFNAEVCYAGGIRLEAPENCVVDNSVREEIRKFYLDNNIPFYFLGSCKDLKYFEFAVSVLIFSKDRKSITNIYRKEAAHCRFAEADKNGDIPYVLYGNWRTNQFDASKIEKIPLINPRRPLSSIHEILDNDELNNGELKMAYVTKIPKGDSFYYPIPDYASLFLGHWYKIKRYIGAAKEAKLKNSAPIKYVIEVSAKYFEQLCRSEGILDPQAQRQRAIRAKQEMIEFLTGAENSGKALFSNFDTSPEGHEIHHVKITKIENQPQGGDWESDHQEAVNMLCFAMRVHSNLVGSVPGKAQSNNSGSDKRELYTIAQAMQRPYHDILLHLFRLIVEFNGWNPMKPVVPYIQLTTLDSHKDFQEVKDQE